MSRLSLMARLGLNATGFKTGLKQAEGAADRFSRNTTSVIKSRLAGLLGAAAIAQATRGTLEYAGKVKNVADQYGLTTDAVQAFDFAASQNNATLEDFQRTMDTIARNRDQALSDEAGKMAAAFRDLGVSAEDLRSKRLDEILHQISRSIQAGGDSQQRLTAALIAMGESGSKLMPAMLAGLDEMASLADETGAIIEDKFVRSLTSAGDAMDRLKFRSRSTFATILNGAAKAFQFIETGVAGVAAFAGNLSVTGSISEAAKARDEASASVIARDIAQDQAQEQARNVQVQAQTRARRAVFEALGPVKGDAKQKGASIATTSAQSIGAFIARNPQTDELKRANHHLTRIERNTKPTARRGIEFP